MQHRIDDVADGAALDDAGEMAPAQEVALGGTWEVGAGRGKDDEIGGHSETDGGDFGGDGGGVEVGQEAAVSAHLAGSFPAAEACHPGAVMG